LKAAIYRKFRGEINIENLPDPTPAAGGVVLKVEATGICRSDWHGWMGHDADIVLPHVPGHELAGTIVEMGSEISSWNIGDRVTLPFVCGCGSCPPCTEGNPQVCDHQFQPGFTHWGSFAEYVSINYAEQNLVRLPETMSFVEAASLGCRFITAFRGVVDQGQLKAGQWISIFGCGGVGLSAIAIAKAIGAKVIAVDIDPLKLELAKSLGADHCLLSNNEVIAEIREITNSGCHVSVDALGSAETSLNSVMALRKRGKHIQLGLMTGDHTNLAVPMDRVVAHELEIIGSHGMPAIRYEAVFDLIDRNAINLDLLIEKKVTLSEGVEILTKMNEFPLSHGIAIINSLT
jgi:alcohol dehydrogenase